MVHFPRAARMASMAQAASRGAREPGTMLRIGALLEHWADHRPEGLAVVCGAERLDWRTLHQRVHRCANALQSLGLRQGDRLAVMLPNGLPLLELYRAAATLGLGLVPLSPLLQAAGLAALLRDARAAALVHHAPLRAVVAAARDGMAGVPMPRTIEVGGDGAPADACYEALLAAAPARRLPVAPVDEQDLCHLMYSSGTTGLPKGIVLTQRIRALYALLFATRFRIDADSVVLHAGSLVFNGAFVTLMPAWLQGCAYVLLERFDAVELVEAVRRERATHVMLVPSQIAALLQAPNLDRDALSSLRMVCSLGAPLPLQHKRALLELLPDAVYELYGLTEGFVTVLDARDCAAHAESVGVPLPWSALRIVGPDGADLPPGAVGEIVGRGPLLTPGYFGRPDLTAEALVDGWLHSGDLGYVDAQGYLHLVDRAKDLIISGGVNVYPRDVEEVAATHPQVREAAVFGVPDPAWGERPVAALVLREGAADDAAALCEWINARVAARYQRLREVVVVEALPRNIAGKTLKRELRERYLAARAP